MKKNKLILTSLSGLSLAASSIAAVACSTTKESKVIFEVTFSRDKEQWNAIQDLVTYYNDNIIKPEKEKITNELKIAKENGDSAKVAELNAKLAASVEVELVHGGSGYNAGDARITTNLKNKNYTDLANLTVNYAPTLARIVEYGKQLDFSSSELGEYSIPRSTFSSEYVKVNDKISGAQEGKLYQLPLLKSTVVFSLNGPVFKTIFKTISEAGVNVPQEIKTEFNVENETWNDDVEYIKSAEMFGAPAESSVIQKLFENITVDNNIFTDFTSLIKFAMAAAQSFPKKSPDINILGVDDINGLLAPVLYGSSVVDGNDAKMPISVIKNSEGKTSISFNKILDKNDPTTKKFIEMFDLIKQAISVKAFRVYGGGAYASVDSVNHKIGGSFSSTAGYNFNFNNSASPFIKLIDPSDSKTQYTIKNSDFGLISETDGNKEVQFGKYKNKILPGERQKISYALYAADEETKAKMTEITAEKHLIKVNKSETKIIAAFDASPESFTKVGNFKVVDGRNETGEKDASVVVYVTSLNFKENLKVEGKFEHVIPSLAKSLQEKEIIAKAQVGKLSKDDTKSASFLQGPNLFGISKSKELDLATARFVKFLTSKDKIQLPQAPSGQKRWENTQAETPFEHISRIASYIVPYEGFETNESLNKTKNAYLKVAFDVFKKATQESTNVILYEEPSSVYSNPFREGIQSVFGGLASKMESGATPTYEDSVISSMTTIINKFQK